MIVKAVTHVITECNAWVYTETKFRKIAWLGLLKKRIIPILEKVLENTEVFGICLLYMTLWKPILLYVTKWKSAVIGC